MAPSSAAETGVASEGQPEEQLGIRNSELGIRNTTKPAPSARIGITEQQRRYESCMVKRHDCDGESCAGVLP